MIFPAFGKRKIKPNTTVLSNHLHDYINNAKSIKHPNNNGIVTCCSPDYSICFASLSFYQAARNTQANKQRLLACAVAANPTMYAVPGITPNDFTNIQKKALRRGMARAFTRKKRRPESDSISII